MERVDRRVPNPNEYYVGFPGGRKVMSYAFYTNDSCDRNSGYFKFGKDRDYGYSKYLGTKTRYRIRGDNLEIYDLAYERWDSKRVLSLNNDTLVLAESDSVFLIHTRFKLGLTENFEFESIVVSTSVCFGTCPVLNVRVDSTGDVLFFGEYYVLPIGLYKSVITKERFKEFAARFKKANAKNLKNSYSENATDQETITVSFVKDGGILKTVTDYGYNSPHEFISAYTPLIYLNQSLELDTLDSKPFGFIKFFYGFNRRKEKIILQRSEAFLLLTELLNSSKVDKKYNVLMKADYLDIDGEKKEIPTDGQFYRIGDQVYDLGYNFF